MGYPWSVLGAILLLGFFSTGQCRKCTFEDEAAVMLCSRDLISEHYELNTNKENGTESRFNMDLAKVGKICDKYENFVECARNVNVSRKCRSKSLPNLISLWEFVCAEDFRKQVGDEQSCYKAMGRDPAVKQCVGNNTVDISQVRQNGGDQFCLSAQSTLECYKEFDHLEKCIQAVKLEKNLHEFLIQNFSSYSTVEEGSTSCEFIEIDVLMKQFETMQKEKAIGGCDETGACKCIDGYTINNETKKCIDVDECATGSHECSQKCTNTEGGYKCSCDDQYYSLASPQSNHSCVRSNDSAPVWLIFAHGQSIWNVSDDGKFVELKLAGLEKTAMLDVNIKEKALYFVDNGRNLIQRVNLNTGSAAKPEVIQNYEVDGVEGIAVDYIGRNLYYARKSDIFVQSLDGKYRMRLYKNKLATPRALVVHPQTGTLYGSDWSSAAFIYKAAMDGSSFEKIVSGKENVVWPNGLAIDHFAQRIYWADAFLDSIQSMDMNGGARRVVIANSGAVAHLFGLAIADDYVYWTDWNHRGILRANKLTGQNVTLLAQTTLLPYGIKVFHEIAQPSINGTNPCDQKNCSHICLLTKNSSEAMCSCADGYNLNAKDGRTCKVDCKESAKNVIVCGGSEPKCVNKRYVCDGILHCPDRLDEQNCPERVCPLGQFQCHDDPKNCLESGNICDGTKQCKDGSDEKFCSQKKMR